MQIFGTIIFGALIGALARLAMPGKQDISPLITVLVGIAGALVGYLVYPTDTNGIDWIRLIISIVVAMVLVGLYGRWAAGRAKV